MISRASIFALALIAAPALAETTYLDDRSTPEAVIRSLYSAINRHEIVRAYDYWVGSPDVPVFSTFSAGYAKTERVEIKIGVTSSEGAAGSVYSTVPVALRSTSTSGVISEFAGCYTLRQVQPSMQSQPPFQAIHIVSGHLKPAKGPLTAALPRLCE